MPKIDKAIPSTVIWADVAVADIAKARAFYGELFGWAFTGGDDEKMGFYTTANRDGRRVAAMAVPPNDQPAAWNIYIATENADETAKKVEAAGGKTLAPPMSIMDLGRMAQFEDPTGATFGVWQPGTHTGMQLYGEPGAMAWHEVYTRDAKQALEFYTKVFGLKSEKMPGGMEYWTLHAGDHLVGGLMQMGDSFPKGEGSHWNTYFAVSDPDASVKKLDTLGGKVRQPAFDTPYGRMAAVTDPFGAELCLIKPANGSR